MTFSVKVWQQHRARVTPNSMNSLEAGLAAKHLSPHLRRLEAEAISIMRETAAEFRKPVMLYSIGKDSSVMLHIALKASTRRSCRSPCCTSIPPGNSAK